MGKKSSRKKIKYNLQNNLQNKKTETSAIILGSIGGFIIFVIAMKMLKFICCLRAKLNATSNFVCVTPGDIAVGTSSAVFVIFLFIAFFIAFLLIVICVRLWKNRMSFSNEFMRIKSGFMKIKIDTKFMKSRKSKIIIIIILLDFFNLCVDYSIIYKDRIFHRSITNVFGKYYGYSDIKEVKVYDAKNTLSYCLIMKDGTKINLTSIRDNSKFIPEVESHIDSKVPHIIDRNYSSALNKIPKYISEKFKMIKS
ncbi:hypothetical protein [Clostridium sp. JS66]|uniref:hypothetical protein n=1 Tax=Clostridium sp. JS66 TaxID=3064705 RepID=UPI00298E93C9|nr:hypothetical protein [Clostridium sp. JS66]WPC43738.1 hypothetical protein Q6H37_09755 [Clostridium sp. JS66]